MLNQSQIYSELRFRQRTSSFPKLLVVLLHDGDGVFISQLIAIGCGLISCLGTRINGMKAGDVKYSPILTKIVQKGF